MLEILAHKNTKHRIVQLLLILSSKFGIIKNQEVEIILSISRNMLSKITGSSKNSVNKVLQQMQKKDTISYCHNIITIRNISRLINYYVTE